MQSNVGDTVGRPQVDEVKSETGWNLLVNEGNVPVIDISSDSDSDSSESNSCSSTSSQGDSIDLDAEDAVDTQRDAVDTAVNLDVWAKNVKTKIVHKCRNEVSIHVGDQQMFGEVFGGSLTCCGRDITKSYHSVVGPCDWTSKCRICFKGKRAPCPMMFACMSKPCYLHFSLTLRSAKKEKCSPHGSHVSTLCNVHFTCHL